MEQDNLFKSYFNSVSTMDNTNVKPYTETEVQPLYSSIWVNKVIKSYLDINPKSLTIDQFINPSVIRSMLIMDLMDCEFSRNHDLKSKVFQWYDSLLDNFYTEDKYSLYKNTPNITFKYSLKDLSYFKTNNIINVHILNSLFEICYKKHHDIYADNGYEVLGPYHINNSTYVIYNFYNILHEGNKIEMTLTLDGTQPGKVDLFGHSTVWGNKAEYTIVNDGNILYENLIDELNLDIIHKKDEIIFNSSILTNIYQRAIRYKKYSDTLPNPIPLQDEIYPRITDPNQLLKLITF